MAYKDSETDHGADLYYFNVTSMLSVMKTSVYLVETLASDLFIVRPPLTVHGSRECSYPASPVVSMLCCLELKSFGHRSPSASLYRRRGYVSRALGVGTCSTVIVPRDRNCRCLHPVATHAKAESRVQSRARANHKFFLLLHSRSEQCLHWYVHLNSFICRPHDS